MLTQLSGNMGSLRRVSDNPSFRYYEVTDGGRSCDKQKHGSRDLGLQ
jgi:hypothetical protein